jgi:hypothetical protein
MTEQTDDVTATFEDLTADDVAETTARVTLASGRKITVRGLSRYELILASAGGREGPDIEAYNLSVGVVDPKLTFAQARAWQKRSQAGGDIGMVSRTIRDLSGLGEGADKSDG